MKVSQTSWSTMWTFESSDFVDTYLQRGLCHTSFISDLKLITISFQVHVYHHKTLFNLGSLLGGLQRVQFPSPGFRRLPYLNEHSSEISVAGEWVTWLALIVFIALSRSRSLFPKAFNELCHPLHQPGAHERFTVAARQNHVTPRASSMQLCNHLGIYLTVAHVWRKRIFRRFH